MTRNITTASGQLDLFGQSPSPDGSDSTDGPCVAPVAILASTLLDAGDRWRIATDLSTSLFVEAGAGAGKTSMLATRVVSLLAAGEPVSTIAAITFTEKAAAELRSRIRVYIEAALSTGDRGPKGMPIPLLPHERAHLLAALDALDSAAIGTLHSFAQRILREFPLDAGLPPTFTVADEVASDLAFDRRWTAYLDSVLDDERRAEIVLFASAIGMRTDDLRAIAESFTDNWDLVEERVSLSCVPPAQLDATPYLDALDALLATTAPPLGDKVQTDYLPLLHRHTHRLKTAPDDFTVLELMAAAAFKPSRWGSKKNWERHPQGSGALDEFRGAVEALGPIRDTVVRRYREQWRLALGSELGMLTLANAYERAVAGHLDFQDLLVLTRNLVRHRPHIRAELHNRYRHLLLDEFQDTDPIQLEIAVRITAAETIDPNVDWRTLQPLPGRVFIVGDPKQSIYRFRRADMAMYLSARQTLPVERLALTTNFRSQPAVLDWINHVFAQLIQPVPDGQPEFRALDHFHTADGSVTLLGESVHNDEPAAADIRRREATEIAATVQRIRADGWPIDTADGPRPAGLGDIAILVPARTLLPFIEDAFLAAGIPYQAENSSLVYATAEIRDLLLAARAIADPSDELALLATLRSALFGCSDPDLYRWHERGGRFRLSQPQLPDDVPVGANEPVGDALGWLSVLWREHQAFTPSQILTRIVHERRMFETALASPSPRDTWRRLRFVLDQARAWSDAGGVGLRHYLEWTRRLGAEGRYVAEGVLPETDLHAVRIMTVHAAKGLEFPIAIVAGLSTEPQKARRDRVVWTTDSWDLRKGELHELFRPLDEQMSHLERLRVLYVACTRARDHLVVSLHRKRDVAAPAETATSGELLAWASVAAPVSGPPPPRNQAPSITFEPPQLDWAAAHEWAAERARIDATAGRSRSLSATRFAELLAAGDPAVQKDAVDLEQPAWQRGRYGTAVGRAVHGVLQSVDLHAPGPVESLAVAQAAAEGIDDASDAVRALVQSALAAPTIVAVQRDRLPVWQELYVGAPLGDRVVEGYVDLLVRTDAGLVVVDYKTDRADDDEAIAAKVDRYAPQLAVYGVALEQLLNERIVGGTLIFCSATRPAREIPIPRWRDLVDAVRAQLQTGHEPVHVGGV